MALISGKTKTELYKYLKCGGGSYNELRICFQNCDIKPRQDIQSVSSTNKDQFLDSYIVPLDLTKQADAKKLVCFITQVVDFLGTEGQVAPQAKALYDSLIRDGWENRGNNFVRGGTQLFNGQTYVTMPSSVEQVLEALIRGLKRATYPLRNRRANFPCFAFDNEYDFQDLLHALMMPWIRDIRREDYVAKYLGTNKRVDFFLPDYSIILEVKFIRDRAHAKKVGDELVIDITHYQNHSGCEQLWIIIVDADSFLENPGGLQRDLVTVTSRILVKPFLV